MKECGKLFTEQGMVSLLEEASELFREAHLYQAVSEVYNIVLPIYEAHHNHLELEKGYVRLSECYKELVSRGEHQFLGSYFRVGFHGYVFGEMDCQEFIYKEASSTEFSLKLQVLLTSCYCKQSLMSMYITFYRNCMKKELEQLV